MTDLSREEQSAATETEDPPGWRKRIKWLLVVGVPGALVFFATNKADDVVENLNSWALLFGLASLSGSGALLLAKEPASLRRRRAINLLSYGSAYLLAVCAVALAIKGVTLLL